jgi:prevent-host-death family protein
MAVTTALNFQRNIGRYQELAQREPVEITRHGRRSLVLLSAEEYERLKTRDRRAYAAEEVPDDILDAVGRSRMSRKHRALDDLLD